MGQLHLDAFNQHLYVFSTCSTIPAHTLLWQGQKIVNLPAPLGSLSKKLTFTPAKLNDGTCCEPQIGDIKSFLWFRQRLRQQGVNISETLITSVYKEWKNPPWQRDK